MSYKKELEKWAKQRAKVVALHKAGKTCRDIGNVLGISAQRAHQIIKKENERPAGGAREKSNRPS